MTKSGVQVALEFPHSKFKKVARVEVNILLAFLHWVGIALHP